MRKILMNGEDKRYFRHVLTVTLLIIMFVCAMIAVARSIIRGNAEETCRDNAESAAAQICADLGTDFKECTDYMTLLTSVLDSGVETENLEDFVKNFGGYETISHLEVLLPENVVITKDGVQTPAPDWMNFDAESAKGRYISELSDDICTPEKKVIRVAAPLESDGEVTAVIYGVVEVELMPEIYKSEIYAGNAAIAVVEGESGNFIMDTWHDTLGNINDLGEREPKKGYNDVDIRNDLKAGVSNHIVFLSHTTGEYLYTYYTPVGINDWMIMINIPESAVFSESKSSLIVLYFSVALLIGMMTIYFLWLLRKIHSQSMFDPLTKVRNREFYERKIKRYSVGKHRDFSCIYIDANGLHALNNVHGHAAGDKMLRSIAKNVKKTFGDCCYRIGGDEFVVFVENMPREDVYRNAEKVKKRIEDEGIKISYGIQYTKQLKNIDDVIDRADKKMRGNKYTFYQAKMPRSSQPKTATAKLADISLEDADTFLAVIAPKFIGGYIVDFDRDVVREIYIPDHFKRLLARSDDNFFAALRLYSNETVSPDYQRSFSMFFDKDWIISQLDSGKTPQLIYDRTDGVHIRLRVMKTPKYRKNAKHETAWLFEEAHTNQR